MPDMQRRKHASNTQLEDARQEMSSARGRKELMDMQVYTSF
jgi:hypothetical protein